MNIFKFYVFYKLFVIKFIIVHHILIESKMIINEFEHEWPFIIFMIFIPDTFFVFSSIIQILEIRKDKKRRDSLVIKFN